MSEHPPTEAALEGFDFLATEFQAHRPHLRAVAYRILGSTTEADDALQEAWLRLSRTDATTIDNLGGWLTTVVARLCLSMLQSRRVRREQPLEDRLPDPIIGDPNAPDPEHEAILGDSVGLAMLVVLETLTPAERLAFVLHDMFAVPFDEIADIAGRSPAAVRQLASRGRRRVQGVPNPRAADRRRQREVVDAFLAAARNGDFAALMSLLDPDVVHRADTGPAAAGVVVTRGAEAVAARARSFDVWAGFARPALVNGLAGIVTLPDVGPPLAVLSFTVKDGTIIEIDILADPDRLARLDLSALTPAG